MVRRVDGLSEALNTNCRGGVQGGDTATPIILPKMSALNDVSAYKESPSCLLVSPEVGNLCFPTILLPNQAEGQDGVMGSQNKEGVGPEQTHPLPA